jgi:hypothetical protein
MCESCLAVIRLLIGHRMPQAAARFCQPGPECGVRDRLRRPRLSSVSAVDDLGLERSKRSRSRWLLDWVLRMYLVKKVLCDCRSGEPRVLAVRPALST